MSSHRRNITATLIRQPAPNDQGEPDMTTTDDLVTDLARVLADLEAQAVQPGTPLEQARAGRELRTFRRTLIDALHRAIKGLDCITAVHICYGYGIEENLRWKETLGREWRQYEEIFPALNRSQITQVSLECAQSRVPMNLMRLLKDKELMVGVVSVTGDRVESSEEVADTIRAVMQHVDPERLFPCTNCGMAPIPYEVALAKLNSLCTGTELVRRNL